ncbi:MAG: hypothetical protein BGO81_03950 [Devosia sp. 66-22]|nr:MAG: hypothetical protein BGO81_03950 [Devosia sp. 66-22]
MGAAIEDIVIRADPPPDRFVLNDKLIEVARLLSRDGIGDLESILDCLRPRAVPSRRKGRLDLIA